MIGYYLGLKKYDVNRDYDKQKFNYKLYLYKTKALQLNGFADQVKNVLDTSPQFLNLKRDEEGLEQAVDVSDVYPISLEAEKEEITKKIENLNYLKDAHNTYEYCRTRCKVPNQQYTRNFAINPNDNQMCMTDCMNIRYEYFNNKRPGNDLNYERSVDLKSMTSEQKDDRDNYIKSKNFIWIA